MAILPPLNFLTLHYVYFVATCLVSSVIFYFTSSPWRGVAYVDAIFLCVNAMTGAGLNTVGLSTLNTFQQAILFVLLILGSSILISSTVLMVRKRAFEVRFKGVPDERETSRRASTLKLHSLHVQGDSSNTDVSAQGVQPQRKPIATARQARVQPSEENSIHWLDDDQVTVRDAAQNDRHHHRVFSMAGVGAQLALNIHPRVVSQEPRSTDGSNMFGFKDTSRGNQNHFSFKGNISRNSQFHGLTSAEWQELGGVEYRAVSLLSWIVSIYFCLSLILGMIGVGWWLRVNHPELARVNGLDPFWTGAFCAVSAFVNSGMSLLDKNMTALQLNAYPLITLGILILAGNTLYPCFLRFIIWTMKLTLPNRPAWKSWKVTLDFILDHPRRVYTNMFPARHTWYLLATIIILNGIDWAAFELLSIRNQEFDTPPFEYQVLDGLFQALAVRAGGFNVVNMSDLRQGLLVLYVLMMYVSAYPVLVTIRNTNVYEERSLGIYAHDESPDKPSQSRRGNVLMDLIRHHMGRSSPTESSHGYFLHQQLRSQLSHDIWWIALAVFLICIAESDHYRAQPVAYSTFNIIFEVVSAYGCVGVSVGFPGKNYSFCGAWHTVSKLILAAVALRGRHRGLPVAIDKAIMLPSEPLAWAEEEDAAIRRARSRAWSIDRISVGSV